MVYIPLIEFITTWHISVSQQPENSHHLERVQNNKLHVQTTPTQKGTTEIAILVCTVFPVCYYGSQTVTTRLQKYWKSDVSTVSTDHRPSWLFDALAASVQIPEALHCEWFCRGTWNMTTMIYIIMASKYNTSNWAYENMSLVGLKLRKMHLKFDCNNPGQ